MPNVGPLEIAVVLVIVLVIFGPRRLPELGKSMGKGIREFKGSLSMEDKDEISAESSTKPAEVVEGEVVTEHKA
ncbi:MAG TPA: twin-arginine translocase TatA/TatE family subunit [Solirubrobacterales bacterium]